jgi:PIN domain nuclease of toxin-antitoxin system
MSLVLDASTLLAVFHREAGFEAAEPLLPYSLTSSVNLCEDLTEAVERDVPVDIVERWLRVSSVIVVPFDRRLAVEAAQLRAATRRLSLSLGDRACIALARQRGLPILTADRVWRELEQELGLDIRLFR